MQGSAELHVLAHHKARLPRRLHPQRCRRAAEEEAAVKAQAEVAAKAKAKAAEVEAAMSGAVANMIHCHASSSAPALPACH